MKHKWIMPLALLCLSVLHSFGAETLFAGYFDIQTGQPAGAAVYGKINLKRNKDALRIDLKAEKRGKKQKLFQLAINHGKAPQDDSYRYMILSGTTPEDVVRFVTGLKGASSISVQRNDAKVMAVWNAPLKMTQIAFYEPGSVSIDTGMKQPLEVAVDRPALVMLKETDDSLAVTVTDPLHSIEEPTIKVAVNRKLSGDACSYDPATGVSTLSFTHSTEEVYAGKPVSRVLRID